MGLLALIRAIQLSVSSVAREQGDALTPHRLALAVHHLDDRFVQALAGFMPLVGARNVAGANFHPGAYLAGTPILIAGGGRSAA